jgi:hypothetical protein
VNLKSLLDECLASRELCVIIARRPCILIVKRLRELERANATRRRPMPGKLTNVVVAGLGGQGVLKASDILADVAVRAGFDVKKSEIKGMSQRGGSVSSDVRFGDAVLSPMVPPGEADFLLVLEPTQVEPNRHFSSRMEC